MNYLRSFIRQVLLTESAKNIQDLGDKGYRIFVEQYIDQFIISYDLQSPSDDEDSEISLGSITISRLSKMYGGRDGPGLGCWVVAGVDAYSGWGPLLYDVAIELAGTEGLAPDRASVSADAKLVWDYYLERRPDIKHRQLDDLNNTLTPSPNDNAFQGSALRYNRNWSASSLSKVYYANGTPTMDRLKELGLIEFDHSQL